MPKKRAYTREELQGLRRADLQRLCKTYDIKGANAKSEALVDTLANYFASPAFLATPQAESARPQLPTRHNPASRSLPGPASRSTSISRLAVPITHPSRTRPASAPSVTRDTASSTEQPSVSTAHSTARQNGLSRFNRPGSSCLRVKPSPSTRSMSRVGTRTEAPVSKSATDAVASTPEIVLLRAEVSQLREEMAKWDTSAIIQTLEKTMEDKINDALAKQIDIIKQREDALAVREAALADAWTRLEASRHKLCNNPGDTEDVLTASPGREIAFKRKSRDSDTIHQPQSKRLRMPSTAYSLQSSEDASNPDSIVNGRVAPRTPSPSRCVMSSDHAVVSIMDDTEGERAAPFATMPQPPGESASPTVDRPDRPSRKDGPPPLRTDGLSFRLTHQHHARRTPSRAHIDLSAVTESEDEPGGSRLSRASFIASIAVKEDSTMSPPTLSPSPAIGGDNFTYTPLPPPRPATPLATTSKAGAGKVNEQKAFSPAREYMNIALNGLTNPSDSPSAFATPSSRTMLGTERFRDTRFADEPVVPWASPKVDLGPDTPIN